MARVYQALKARVMAGEFAPGERIDPARLSADLSASATPIRDALHRLAGERLVENWQHEGFRQPIVTEASLRYLYGWSDDLVRIILRVAARGSQSSASLIVRHHDAPVASIALFEWLATLSPSQEHRAAMMSLNDRCHALRVIEEQLIGPPDTEALGAAIQTGNFGEARRWSAGYHASRLRRLPELAAHFRPREIV
ncbi:MAG: GntR family transcriptional regulator [Pseudomonadota bacterium]